MLVALVTNIRYVQHIFQYFPIKKHFFAHNVAEFHSVIDVANNVFQESAHVHNALFLLFDEKNFFD